MWIRSGIIIVLAAGVVAGSVAASKGSMKEDKTHIRKWNSFADKLLALHRKLIKGRQVEVKSKIGGYSTHPRYFKEEKYYDKKTGKLISKIHWERKNPKNLHSIEIYVRDKQGRIIRDYSVTYLPEYRNSPVQTLINFHGYSGKMHGFRQFDASGDLIYEQCEGIYKGKTIVHRMFEDMLINGGPHAEKIMASVPYKMCFKGVVKRIGKDFEPY